jgi:hypothetical protein
MASHDGVLISCRERHGWWSETEDEKKGAHVCQSRFASGMDRVAVQCYDAGRCLAKMLWRLAFIATGGLSYLLI